jgi:hypothetical protein
MQSGMDVRSQVHEVLERFNHLVSTRDPQVLAEFAPGDEVLLVGSDAGEVAAGRGEIEAFFTRVFARPVTFSWQWDRLEAWHPGALSPSGDKSSGGDRAQACDVVWFFAEGWVILSTAEQQRRTPYRVSGVIERHGERWLWRQYHGSEPVINQ